MARSRRKPKHGKVRARTSNKSEFKPRPDDIDKEPPLETAKDRSKLDAESRPSSNDHKPENAKIKSDEGTRKADKAPIALSRQTHKKRPKANQTIGILGIVMAAIAAIIGMISLIPQWSHVCNSIAHRDCSIGIADDNETLILITNFSGDDTIDIEGRIRDDLRKEKTKLNLGVRIEYSAVEPLDPNCDAQCIGKNYHATMVIWGLVDSVSIHPHYEIIENQEKLHICVAMASRTSSNLQEYNGYIDKGAPNEYKYLMLITLGQIALADEKPAQAIDAFTNALSIDLSKSQSDLRRDLVYMYRGEAYSDAGNADLAISNLREATQLNSTLGKAYFDLGIQYQRNQNWQQALDSYDQAESHNYRTSCLYYNRGTLIFRQMGITQVREAEQDLNKAIDMDKQNANAFYVRSLIRKELSDSAGELQDLKQLNEGCA